jgi:hypothetical protein
MEQKFSFLIKFNSYPFLLDCALTSSLRMFTSFQILTFFSYVFF